MGKRFVRTWTVEAKWHRLCLEHIAFVNEEASTGDDKTVCLHFVSGETVTLKRERYEEDILPCIVTLAESTEQLLALNQSLEALVSFARSLDERDTHRFARGG